MHSFLFLNNERDTSRLNIVLQYRQKLLLSSTIERKAKSYNRRILSHGLGRMQFVVKFIYYYY